MRQLRDLFRLTGSDVTLLATAFVLLGVMRFGLRLLPFRNVLKLQQKMSNLDFHLPTSSKSQISISKIVWAVNVATRYMPGHAKCLARALTTQVLMNSYGYHPELRIGVAKGEGGTLEAHAWIEYQGQVAIGYLTDLSRFIPLPSFEGASL
ncbi:MAG: lasso peptide biosynthesis B2 protein [Rhizonema sp. PD37]|nr:lasso peptide biosynthesis B2 protein [Rhizonema sp. PD37]